jgi:hypothetical protein
MAFVFYAFLSRDKTGKPLYDNKNGLLTMVDYETVEAIYTAINYLIIGKPEVDAMRMEINCTDGASLILVRAPSKEDKGQMESSIHITRGDKTLSFPFSTMECEIKVENENRELVTKVFEAGLWGFRNGVFNYLFEVGAVRHLYIFHDKFDELEVEKRETPDGTLFIKDNSKQFRLRDSYQVFYPKPQTTPSGELEASGDSQQ